jgi:hypothetical protein
MRILSIDIGTKNCAFYIEEFSETELTKIKKLKAGQQIEQLYKTGKRVYWKVVDFEKDLKSGVEVFVPIIKFLDDNRGVWDLCNGIIIEKQLRINYNAQVVQHFIFSYFKNLYGPFKYISDISATRKTQTLGAPKKMEKKDRKKWAVTEVTRLMALRDDFDGLKILHTAKADDLADACLQLKAFQKLVFIEGTLP